MGYRRNEACRIQKARCIPVGHRRPSELTRFLSEHRSGPFVVHRAECPAAHRVVLLVVHRGERLVVHWVVLLVVHRAERPAAHWVVFLVVHRAERLAVHWSGTLAVHRVVLSVAHRPRYSLRSAPRAALQRG